MEVVCLCKNLSREFKIDMEFFFFFRITLELILLTILEVHAQMVEIHEFDSVDFRYNFWHGGRAVLAVSS